MERNGRHEVDLLSFDFDGALRRDDQIAHAHFQAAVANRPIANFEQHVLLRQNKPAAFLIVGAGAAAPSNSQRAAGSRPGIAGQAAGANFSVLNRERAGNIAHQRAGNRHIGPFQGQRELALRPRRLGHQGGDEFEPQAASSVRCGTFSNSGPRSNTTDGTRSSRRTARRGGQAAFGQRNIQRADLTNPPASLGLEIGRAGNEPDILHPSQPRLASAVSASGMWNPPDAGVGEREASASGSSADVTAGFIPGDSRPPLACPLGTVPAGVRPVAASGGSFEHEWTFLLARQLERIEAVREPPGLAWLAVWPAIGFPA